MQTGVYQDAGGWSWPGGWTWRCAECGAVAPKLLRSREDARTAYKEHRLKGCTQKTSAVVEIPSGGVVEIKQESAVMNPTKKKTTKKKTTEKKVAKKKMKKLAKKTTVKKVAKKKTTKGDAILWRIGFGKNKNTGREVTPNVSKEGKIRPYQHERFGMKKVDRWVEILSPTRADALARARTGEGEWFGPGKAKKTGKAKKKDA